MKKKFMVAALMCSSVVAFAQHAVGSFNLQPKVGINVSTITNGGSLTENKVGFVGGLEGEYQVNNLLSLSAAAIYSQQGYKCDHKIDFVDDKVGINYINVPIMANFYVVEGLALKAGVQPGFVVSDDTEIAESFDFSVPVGISYEYANFQLDARYNIGCTKVFKGTDEKNSVFQVTLGYKFDL